MMISSSLEVSVRHSVWRDMTWSTCLLTERPSGRESRYDKGPVVACTSAGIHLGWFVEKFRQYTKSPGLKDGTWRFLRLAIIRAWLFPTWSAAVLGNRRSNLVRRVRPNISKAGDIPVDVCGVVRYANRKRDNLVSRGPVSFFIPSLKVCTALSARPFEAGWYGATFWWAIPFSPTNFWNSALVKTVALSETITRGNPKIEKIFLSFSMVETEVVLDIMWTSNHLLCASTTTRNIFPRKGPAKSMCIRDQGRSGQCHGWIGAKGGLCRTDWQVWQLFTSASRSSSILGHHTYPLASDFILQIPGWATCNSQRTTFQQGGGTMILEPRKMQPFSALNSFLLEK